MRGSLARWFGSGRAAHRLADVLGAGVVVCSRSGRIRAANPAAVTLLARPLVGEHLDAVAAVIDGRPAPARPGASADPVARFGAALAARGITAAAVPGRAGRLTLVLTAAPEPAAPLAAALVEAVAADQPLEALTAAAAAYLAATVTPASCTLVVCAGPGLQVYAPGAAPTTVTVDAWPNWLWTPDDATLPADSGRFALTGTRAWFRPLVGAHGPLGALCVGLDDHSRVDEGARRHFDRCAELVELALVRHDELARLRRTEARFRAMVERSTDGIVLVGARDRIVFATPAVATMVGVPLETLVGAPLDQWVTVADRSVPCGCPQPDPRPAHVCAGRGARVETWEIRRPDDVRRIAEAAVSDRRGDPAVGARVCNVRDVTDALAALAELEHRRVALVAALDHVESVREQTRRALAIDLHDRAIQSLVAARTHVAAARRGPATTADLATAEALLSQALTELRTLMVSLHEQATRGGADLAADLDGFLRRLAARAGVRVDIEVTGDPTRVPPEIACLALRTVQEAATNVIRHAHARRLECVLRVDDTTLHGEVRDDGVGVDPAALAAKDAQGHLGVVTMRDTVTLAGGRFVIEPHPVGGTRVGFEIPLAFPSGPAGGGSRRTGYPGPVGVGHSGGEPRA